MLNEYLPNAKIQNDLKDYISDWGFLLNQINPENTIPLVADSELMSILHHALNIDKYKQQKFRQLLLEFAPDKEVMEFAKSMNKQYKSLDETRAIDFRRQLASFQWGHNDDTKNFVKIFGYDDYLVPIELEKHITLKSFSKHENPYRQLKEHQAEIFFKAQKLVEIPNKKFLIQMPTGAGKTRVAMEVVSSFLNKKENRQVIWLADRTELCEQAADTFENIWSHVGKRELTLYQLWGDYVDIPDKIEDNGFVIAMYQKIRNPLKQGKLNLSPDLIITDEAHNILAKTYSETIDGMRDFMRKQTRIIGLTATPGRATRDIQQNKKLVSFFNNEIINLTTDFGVIRDLQQKGILAHCIRKPLKTNQKYTLTKEEWNTLFNNFSHEYPNDLLERIAKDNVRNTIILNKLIQLAKESEHILVFGASKRQSKLLCGVMIALGYKAVHVDGETPSSYRKDVVNKFKQGDIQFIFNYGVFTTGFDSPNIDAIMIARPTTSIVLYGQMIGRGMRGVELGGTEEFQLVDVVDDIITEYSGLDNVYEFFSEYWND